MTDTILVDGQPCAGFEQRSKILEQRKGVAVRADDLMGMSREESRALIAQWLPGRGLDELVASANIEAVRPEKP